MPDKQAAYDFLIGLQKRLNSQLPGPEIIRAEVSKRWNMPKADRKPEEQVGCQENIFLYHFALPQISKHVMSIDGIDAEKARQSLRGEYYAKFEHFLSANTRRSQGHPFEKI
jgi:hypothetical protein